MNNKAIFQPSDAFTACDIHKSFLNKNKFSTNDWVNKRELWKGKTIDPVEW